MNPIINPSVIYWIGTLGKINNLFSVIMVLLIVSFILIGLAIPIFWEEIVDSGKSIAIIKWIKRLIITGVIVIPITLFTPSESTMLQMLIADKLTGDNMEKVTEVYDRIINDIDKIVNKDKD